MPSRPGESSSANPALSLSNVLLPRPKHSRAGPTWPTPRCPPKWCSASTTTRTASCASTPSYAAVRATAPAPSRHLPTWAASSTSRCRCTRSRTRRQASRARSSTRPTISTCPRTARRASCRADAGFAGFWLQESRLRRSGLADATTGSPSWAPPTSAPSASWASSACRRAAWRSTWPADRPRSSRTSPHFYFEPPAAPRPTRSWSTRCSTARASAAPTAS